MSLSKVLPKRNPIEQPDRQTPTAFNTNIKKFQNVRSIPMNQKVIELMRTG